MRIFYDNWKSIDYNSSVATDEFNDEQNDNNIVVNIRNNILRISDINSFPIESFFKVPFTHHLLIIGMVKEIDARYHYIHRTAEEHLSVEQLKKIINENDFENRATMPNNFPRTISNSS